jgi:hypothetical protein
MRLGRPSGSFSSGSRSRSIGNSGARKRLREIAQRRVGCHCGSQIQVLRAAFVTVHCQCHRADVGHADAKAVGDHYDALSKRKGRV